MYAFACMPFCKTHIVLCTCIFFNLPKWYCYKGHPSCSMNTLTIVSDPIVCMLCISASPSFRDGFQVAANSPSASTTNKYPCICIYRLDRNLFKLYTWEWKFWVTKSGQIYSREMCQSALQSFFPPEVCDGS